MKYEEAMRRYGVDKPDTRFGLELVDITDIVRGSGFKLFAQAKLVKAMKVPGGESMTRKEIDAYTEFVKIYGAMGLAWIKIKENEWQSPIAKFLSEEERAGIREALDLQVGDIVFFQAGEPAMVNAALGNLRVHLGNQLGLIPENTFNFLWVTEFPLFEYSEEEKRYVACHHPFTSPAPGHLEIMNSDPARALARAYDMVLNGNEVGGGSIRIHSAEVQRHMVPRPWLHARAGRGPVRLPHPGPGARCAAARWSGLWSGPSGHAAFRCVQHPRRHRLPQDPEGHLPDDRGALHGVRASAA